MEVIFKHLLLLLFQIKILKGFNIEEQLNNPYLYRNELCSYNGKPIYNPSTNEVTCECYPRYANEPNEKKRKYINGNFIQCSYKRKSKFMVLFLALCIPIGIDFLYLERRPAFIIILILSIIIISFNTIIFILSHKSDMKSKKSKIQKKMTKLNKKVINKNNDIDDGKKIRKYFNITKILFIIHLIFVLVDIIGHATGMITDYFGVATENDLNYIFETPD